MASCPFLVCLPNRQWGRPIYKAQHRILESGVATLVKQDLYWSDDMCNEMKLFSYGTDPTSPQCPQRHFFACSSMNYAHLDMNPKQPARKPSNWARCVTSDVTMKTQNFKTPKPETAQAKQRVWNPRGRNFRHTKSLPGHTNKRTQGSTDYCSTFLAGSACRPSMCWQVLEQNKKTHGNQSPQPQVLIHEQHERRASPRKLKSTMISGHTISLCWKLRVPDFWVMEKYKFSFLVLPFQAHKGLHLPSGIRSLLQQRISELVNCTFVTN